MILLTRTYDLPISEQDKITTLYKNMLIDYSKHHVITLMSMFEANNFELTKELMREEMDLIEAEN
jgi:hypothetical protein